MFGQLGGECASKPGWAAQQRSREEGAAHRQIEDVQGVQGLAEQRGDRLLAEPAGHLLGVGHGGQPAGAAQGVVGQPWVDGGQLLQGGPGGLFADREIGIGRLQRTLVGCLADADTQAHADQIPKYCKFSLFERVDGAVAGSHLGYGCKRVWFLQQHIRSCDGQIGDPHAVDHIAQVQDAGNCAKLVEERSVAGDQHIVVVGVAVDHLVWQIGQQWSSCLFEPFEQAAHLLPASEVGDLLDLGAHHLGSVGQVPVKDAVQRRVVVAGQGAVDSGEKTAEVVEQLRPMGAHPGQRAPRHKTEQAHIIGTAGAVDYLADRLPVQRAHDRAARQASGCNPVKRMVLGVEQRSGLCSVGNFEHKALAGSSVDLEILVAFAGQRQQHAADPILMRGEQGSLLWVKTGRRLNQRPLFCWIRDRCMFHKGHYTTKEGSAPQRESEASSSQFEWIENCCLYWEALTAVLQA